MSKITVLLVGTAGKGKSTTANCLINQSTDEDKIRYGPFKTSDTAKSCTQNAELVESSSFRIIDTVGFGDPTKTSEECLQNMTNAIDKENSKIDLIIYVCQINRFKDDDVECFKLNMDYLKKKLPNSNSFVLINKCYKGWVSKCKEEGTFSRDLNNAIRNCNGNYFEFNLRFSDDQDEEEPPHWKEEFRQQRHESINKLVDYVKNLCHNNNYNYNHYFNNLNRTKIARILLGRYYFSD